MISEEMKNHVSATMFMVSCKKQNEKWIAVVTNFNKLLSEKLHKFSKFQLKISTFDIYPQTISGKQFPFSQNFVLSEVYPGLQ